MLEWVVDFSVASKSIAIDQAAASDVHDGPVDAGTGDVGTGDVGAVDVGESQSGVTHVTHSIDALPAVDFPVKATRGEELLLPVAMEPFDISYLRYQQWTDCISWFVLWVIVFVAALLGIVFKSSGAWLWGPTGMVGIPVIAMWTIFWYHPRAFAAGGFGLSEDVLVVRSGVWWKSIELLPLSRLQHVDCTSGPVQAKFDVATLTAHTAGASNAAVSVPGLSRFRAEMLRDQLIRRSDVHLREAEATKGEERVAVLQTSGVRDGVEN